MMRRALGFALALACVPACTSPDARYVAAAPDEAQFAPVAQFLVHRCGSYDCHGTVYRNLRIYGNEGLRLDPNDRPLVPATTTAAEVDADYQAVVGLEPEAMTSVVQAGGANPLALTLLRKPLGQENHKGGTLMVIGDAQYKCVASWLAGQTDKDSCTMAAQIKP